MLLCLLSNCSAWMDWRGQNQNWPQENTCFTLLFKPQTDAQKNLSSSKRTVANRVSSNLPALLQPKRKKPKKKTNLSVSACELVSLTKALMWFLVWLCEDTLGDGAWCGLFSGLTGCWFLGYGDEGKGKLCPYAFMHVSVFQPFITSRVHWATLPKLKHTVLATQGGKRWV